MNQAQTDGPVVQSISIGFRVLYAATLVLACFWVASNWRQVPGDSQAVVLRFGRIVGVQPAGLTMSWPRPVGAVVLVPGGERLLTVRTATTTRRGGLQDVFTDANGAVIPEGAGSYLTGDGGVVLLAAAITYQVTDAAAYYLSEPHIAAGLRRVFEACAVGITATRKLDDFLVIGPRTGAGAGAGLDEATLSRRQAVRGDLSQAMNRRLGDLVKRGAGLGVAVSRIDLEATLPPSAKIAFDGVLVAAQLAEQAIAGARTEATRTVQAADRDRNQLLSAAQASAGERVSEARVRTASVAAIAASLGAADRPAMLDQIYRERIAAVLHKVGRITTVPMQDGGARVMVPAAPFGGSP